VVERGVVIYALSHARLLSFSQVIARTAGAVHMSRTLEVAAVATMALLVGARTWAAAEQSPTNGGGNDASTRASEVLDEVKVSAQRVELQRAEAGVNEKARGKARIPADASAYSFRHARISELLQLYGVDPLTVAAQTGTSLAMIERAYLRFIPSALRDKLAGISEVRSA